MKTFLFLVLLSFALTASADSENMVWLGKLEVQAGKLKSSNGQVPRAGETMTLRVFKGELASTLYDNSGTNMGGYGVFATGASLFIRFDDGQDWKEVQLRPADYSPRGPSLQWEDFEDVFLQIPHEATKIEVWLEFQRGTPGDCSLAYDMTECRTLYPAQPAYLSNFGRNFVIKVQR